MVSEWSVILVCLLVLGAEFVNGATDAPNAIATVVSTRVLRPWQALIVAVVFNTVGALVGTAVATTIGKGLVNPEAINLTTVAAATISVIIYTSLTWYFGLPTSESHELVAGLTGAAIAIGGLDVVIWEGWKKVLYGLIFSTFLGFFGGFTFMNSIYKIFSKSSPYFISRWFGKFQIISAAFMAFSHGTGDGQKWRGIFTLALLLGGVISEFIVPVWVILLCGIVMGFGTAFGGWRIIRTMGIKLTRLAPVQGFSAETAAALTIQATALFGIPISTTHTINTAIMGVGATRRLSGVRWGVGKDIVLAWVFTFPICGIISYTIGLLAK